MAQVGTDGGCVSTKKRSDGEGSLHPLHVKGCPKPTDRHDNPACKCPWRGVLVVGFKPDPKRPGKSLPVRKTVTRPTKSGAATALREVRERHASITLPVGKSPTVEQWLNVWHAKHLRKVKDRTTVIYRKVIDSYLIPLLGHHRLDRLTPEDIEDAWATLLDVGNPRLPNPRPLAPSTVHHAHVVLRRALRVAVQRKKLAANPASPDAMDAPPKGDAAIEAIPTEEWKKIRDHAESLPGSARWTVALAVGLRQGEALALAWEDIDLTAGILRVRHTLYRKRGAGMVMGTPKSRQSRREIQMPAQLVSRLKTHRSEQNQARLAAGDHWRDTGLVFTTSNGGAIDDRTDRRRWAELLTAADVPHHRLHAARHTAATMLLLEGVDQRVVMDMMGWSQVSTAVNYQHAVSEAKKDAAEKMGAAFWG